MNRDNSINHMQPQHHLQLYPFVYYSFSCTWSHRISQTVMVTSPAPCMALQEKELGFDATSGEPGIGGGWGRVHDQAILWSHRQDGIRKITVSCVSTGFCTKLSSSIFWTLRSQWSEILALQSFFFPRTFGGGCVEFTTRPNLQGEIGAWVVYLLMELCRGKPQS